MMYAYISLRTIYTLCSVDETLTFVNCICRVFAVNVKGVVAVSQVRYKWNGTMRELCEVKHHILIV